MPSNIMSRTTRSGDVLFALFSKRGCRPQTAGDLKSGDKVGSNLTWKAVELLDFLSFAIGYIHSNAEELPLRRSSYQASRGAYPAFRAQRL